MDFENVNFTSNTESDAVERFVRTLISRNEISLARNIINSLGENYNHLLFELEVQAGNYKKALEIFNYLPKERQQMYIHIADTIEKDAEKVSDAFANLIRSFQSENFPIFIAETQRLKKDYPQVVELVALELLAAIRRGDKKKIKGLSEILEQIDKSHPALSQIKKGKNLGNVFAPAILVALFVVVLANLIISIFSFTTSDIATFSKLSNQIAGIGKTLENLTNQNVQNNAQLTSLTESMENLKANLEKISSLIEESRNQSANEGKVDTDTTAKINEELDKFKKNLDNIVFYIRSLDKKISTLSSSSRASVDSKVKTSETVSQDRLIESIKYNEGQLNKILADFAEVKKVIVDLSRKLDTITAKSVPDKSSSEYDEKINSILISIERISSEINQIKFNMGRTSYTQSTNTTVSTTQTDIALQNLLRAMENVQEQISSLSKPISEKSGSYEVTNGVSSEELIEIKNTLNTILKQLDEFKEQIGNKLQGIESTGKQESTTVSNQDSVVIKSRLDALEEKIEEMKNSVNALKVPERQSSELNDTEVNELKVAISNFDKMVNELKKSTTDSNQDIANIKGKLNSLEQKVEEIKVLVSTLKTSEKEPSQVSSDELSSLKTSISNLEKAVNELKKSTTDSNQDVASIKTKLSNLEQKIEETKGLVSALKTSEKQPSQVNSDELNSLKTSISSLEKTVDELKNTLKGISDQIAEVKNNLAEINKATKVDSSAQKTTSISDVQRVIRETKDLYELYRAGVGYYSNKFYQEALYVLTYVEDQLEGVDVYFKEDIYYYQVLSYLKLGDKQNAQKKFQEYKKVFPNGRYVNELGALF